MQVCLRHRHSGVLWGVVLGLLFATDGLRAKIASDFFDKLEAGDAKSIVAVSHLKSMDDLCLLLRCVHVKRFGTHSFQVKDAVIAALKEIPGHAKELGDRIEKLSGKFGTARERWSLFGALESLASPEAVAQIGRFLLDSRHLVVEGHDDYDPYGDTNSHIAACAMTEALGNRPQPMFYRRNELNYWKVWWQSEDAEKYRRLLREK